MNPWSPRLSNGPRISSTFWTTWHGGGRQTSQPQRNTDTQMVRNGDPPSGPAGAGIKSDRQIDIPGCFLSVCICDLRLQFLQLVVLLSQVDIRLHDDDRRQALAPDLRLVGTIGALDRLHEVDPLLRPQLLSQRLEGQTGWYSVDSSGYSNLRLLIVLRIAIRSSNSGAVTLPVSSFSAALMSASEIVSSPHGSVAFVGRFLT